MSVHENLEPGKPCCLCRPDRTERITVMQQHYVVDLARARQVIRDGRETVELEPDDIPYSLAQHPIDEEHTAHVDISQPGIIAHVWHEDNGGTVHGHRLIDGHHRAAQCLKLGLPFHGHVLTEEESRAVLRVETPAPKAEASDDIRERNRQAWNALVARKQRFTRPATDEYLKRIRISHWLRDVVPGKKVLLLGAGGGSQSVLYAVAGAKVTVVDISDDMLALDREEAQKRGLDITPVQASIDDLSVFGPAIFDVVEQPVSTCYVPDVVAVYREVARVLIDGGVYVSQHKQPTSLQCSIKPGSHGYVLTEPYYRSGPLPSIAGSRFREEGTVEYLHRWEDLIGGLCRSGFVIEDLAEPNRGKPGAARGSFEHRCFHVAPYVRIKARRLGR